MKSYQSSKKVGLFVLSLLLVACSSYIHPNEGNPTVKDIHKTLQRGYAGNRALDNRVSRVHLPSNVSKALLPSLEVEKAGEFKKPIKRFNISVKNVSANAFLLGLVKDTDYNMIVSPEVTGTITLDLKNVTIENILEALRDTYGYRFKRTSYGYEVLPAGLETRIFTVNYLNVSRAGKSHTSISSGQITEKVTGGDDGGSVRDTPPGSSVDTNSRSDFWKSLTKTLIAIIGNQGGRQVIVNPQAGTIIAKAFPDELQRVAEYLDSVQSIMTRQVILEAKILDVSLSKGFESGIDWRVLGLSQDGTTRPLTEGFDALENIFTLRAHKTHDFSVLMELLSTQGNVQVLSSPRIATLNNQKAVIKVGRDEFFITDISSTTSSSSSTTDRTQDVDFTPLFSGIALDVTPEIDSNGGVILHIHPLISKVFDQDKDYRINNEPQSVPLAISDVRESDNVVHAENGQIIVIGGLIESRTAEHVSAVPGIGRVPIFGSFFRTTTQVTTKNELVILLRPIVIENRTWTKRLARSAGRFRKLDKGFHFGGYPDEFGNLGEWQR